MMGSQADTDTEQDKIAYMSKQLEYYISSFHSSVAWYRRRHFITSMATVMLSGLITLIAGWNPKLAIGVDTDNLILVISVIVTGLSAWGAFFSPKESWLVYAATLNKLRALKMKIDFLKAPPSTLDSNEKLINEIYDEYQSIFDAHNKAWLDLRAAPNSMLQGTRGQAARS